MQPRADTRVQKVVQHTFTCRELIIIIVIMIIIVLVVESSLRCNGPPFKARIRLPFELSSLAGLPKVRSLLSSCRQWPHDWVTDDSWCPWHCSTTTYGRRCRISVDQSSIEAVACFSVVICSVRFVRANSIVISNAFWFNLLLEFD